MPYGSELQNHFIIYAERLKRITNIYHNLKVTDTTWYFFAFYLSCRFAICRNVRFWLGSVWYLGTWTLWQSNSVLICKEGNKLNSWGIVWSGGLWNFRYDFANGPFPWRGCINSTLYSSVAPIPWKLHSTGERESTRLQAKSSWRWHTPDTFIASHPALHTCGG